MELFTKSILELLKQLEQDELHNIEKASQIMFDAMKEDKVVHVFATGHSHMFAEEMFYRAGANQSDIRTILNATRRSCKKHSIWKIDRSG